MTDDIRRTRLKDVVRAKVNSNWISISVRRPQKKDIRKQMSGQNKGRLLSRSGP